jgi:hypothetical protein
LKPAQAGLVLVIFSLKLVSNAREQSKEEDIFNWKPYAPREEFLVHVDDFADSENVQKG